MKLEVHERNLSFFEALSSKTRIQIIEMLRKEPLNIKSLAEGLHISSAMVTKHIQKLEQAGIIRCESTSGIRGQQKKCFLQLEHVLLEFTEEEPAVNKQDHYAVSIPIGLYSSFEVEPTCGLASSSGMIGMVDDPRYFADPDHAKAQILWFGSGWIAYRIPNYLLRSQQVKRLDITLELCSEAPGYQEDWPSDIHFVVNQRSLGVWTSPGDFGSRKGILTPDWWNHGTQHGLLKTISVNEKGSFIDGVQLSDITIADLQIGYNKEIYFRIEVPSVTSHGGGLTLFGRHFGNYSQDIDVRIHY